MQERILKTLVQLGRGIKVCGAYSFRQRERIVLLNVPSLFEVDFVACDGNDNVVRGMVLELLDPLVRLLEGREVTLLASALDKDTDPPTGLASVVTEFGC